MDTLNTSTSDLSALFDIDLEIGAQDFSTAEIKKIVCIKCSGRGTFVSYSGRIVGKCFTCNGLGYKLPADRPQGALINVSKVATAFTTAFGNGIKRPKLRLGSFQFSRAPDTGRNAGSIYVKEGEQYLGKVTDGRFYPVRECGDDRAAKVVEVASDPSKAAKAYGLRTGECSCCGRELTKGISIDAGIGPICAEKFGLFTY